MSVDQVYQASPINTREVADAFSRAVIAVVLEQSPRAFEDHAEPQRAEMDDAIPF